MARHSLHCSLPSLHLTVEHGKTNRDLENHKALLVCPLSCTFFYYFYFFAQIASWSVFVDLPLFWFRNIKSSAEMALPNSHAAQGFY